MRADRDSFDNQYDPEAPIFRVAPCAAVERRLHSVRLMLLVSGWAWAVLALGMLILAVVF